MISRKAYRVIAIALLIAVLVGAVCAAIIYDKARQREEDARVAEYMERSHDLRLLRQELVIEYENIEKHTLNKLADGSFIGLVFHGLDRQLYDVVFPLMRDREHPIVGTVCLYPDELPGDDGAITLAELCEITDAGWDVSVYYDGEGDLSELITSMKAELTALGIKEPVSVLFAPDAYSEEHDAILHGHGIKNALHHGEGKRLLIDTSVDGKVWHPGVLAWNTKGFSSALLYDIVNNGGIAYFEVAFEGKFQILFDKDEHARTEAFKRMLIVIEEYIEEDKVVSCGVENAYEKRCEYLSKKEDMLIEIAVRKDEITLELAEVDKKLSEIYKSVFNE